MTYLALLHQENNNFNLVGTKDISVILTKHLYDSLLAISYFPPKRVIADLGSGGGLPAIPLAIYLPKNRFYLIESKTKKANFLNEMKRRLYLNNVEIINQNINEVKKKFAFFTARGFGSIEKIVSITKNISLYPATYFLYKGKRENVIHEMKNLKKNHFKVIPLTHSFFVGERNLVTISIHL